MTLRPERPHSLIETDGLPARDRIHPGQRLVENQQLGIVGDCLRHLDALAQALAVGADLLAGRVGELDEIERAARHGRGFLVADSVEPNERRDPLEAGHPLVERILLGTEADAPIEARVLPDRLAEHRDSPLARLELAGDELHERRLAGAVRAEEAGDARRHSERDVVQADHLTVPLGDVIGTDNRDHVRHGSLGLDHHATTSTPRTRRSSTNADAPMSTAMIRNDTGTGVS